MRDVLILIDSMVFFIFFEGRLPQKIRGKGSVLPSCAATLSFVNCGRKDHRHVAAQNVISWACGQLWRPFSGEPQDGFFLAAIPTAAARHRC